MVFGLGAVLAALAVVAGGDVAVSCVGELDRPGDCSFCTVWETGLICREEVSKGTSFARA
jgi:hypothetical protein